MDNIHHLDLHNSSRHTQPYSIIAKIELGLSYNSCQYHLPLYFVSILQMQLKDPWVFSQLDTSPQSCNPSLHSLMSTRMNKKNEKQKKKTKKKNKILSFSRMKTISSKEVVLNLQADSVDKCKPIAKQKD